MQSKKTSKLVLPIIAGMLVLSTPLDFSLFPSVTHAAAATEKAAVTYKLVKQGESMVTSGVKQITYAWVPSDKSQATEVMHVLQVDLTNEFVRLDALGGKGGSVTARQSVSAMAKETGAVAGINGDVFQTGSTSEGAPMGAQITSGKLLVSTSQLQGMYAFAVTNDKKALIDAFTFTGDVTAADGTIFALTGINKSAYRTEPDKGYSHNNALYIYTSAWTGAERPAASSISPVEALVVDGVVTQVSTDKALPIKTIPANGYILRGHKNFDSGKFIVNHLKVGDKVASQYQLVSQTSKKVYTEADFQMMVSGHTLLMDKGEPAKFTRDIAGVSGTADRARTAVGYSKDGNTAYLITVEENGGREGVSLKDLQQMMKELGVWKAVNMDGGGSTTMVARPLGEFQVTLAHPTFYGTTQRQVTNGIGVFTSAPIGTIKGIVASGPKTLFIGQQASYALKAYDNYYNPIDPKGLQPIWSLSDKLGEFQEGILQVAAAGKTTLNVQAGSAKANVPLEIIGEAQVARLIVEPSSTVLKPGATISVPVKAQLTDGRELAVPASSVTWEFRGFTGAVSNGKLAVDTVEKGIIAGYAIARYDGFGSMAVLTPGTEKTLEDFEKVDYNIGFTGTPAETVGTTSIVAGIPGHETSNALLLSYDFTLGAGKRYAYATLNEANGGIAIDGNPTSLTLDVLGDHSMSWLRAEATNADGETVFLTIADKIDWSGWKTIRVDLTAAGLKGPAKLTKLYVVNMEEDQDERALQGEIAFDNVMVQYPPAPINVYHPTIVLKVGKTKATVDGETVTLPGAPFTQKGTYTNYLPLRFVADRLGAEVKWDNKQRRVTVLRGDTMLDLWVDRKEMTVNGVRMPINVPPIMVKNSVYVPVRVISEQLGQMVDWEDKTKTITIH
ncbi:phosphodiester glycosidase family protein [Cohnella yongneupensis]|uniref:Phosphodiester glycosidase family protein n=1 Tax=Cohnella yongneupensis TaxID=425006 RepID=A0ABW0QVH8_9BACL